MAPFPRHRNKGKGGRPRDPSIDGRVLDAAIALIPERGVDNTSMDDIAAMAHVSKPTIYRRWPSKDDLMLEAVIALEEPLDGIDDPDPKQGLNRVVADLFGRQGRYLDPVLPDPRLRAQFVDRILTPERRQIASLLARGGVEGAAGEPSPRVDAAINLIYGAVFYLRSQQRLGELGDDELEGRIARMVDVCWSGFAAPSAARSAS